MKVKIRSYLGGGLIASIYLPVKVTPTSSANKYAISLLNGTLSSSGKDSSDKGSITEKDLYTGLYKTIAELGLLSDAQVIINKLLTDLFDNLLLDPFGGSGNLASQYLQALNYVNQAKLSQKLYDLAYNLAVSKDSLSEAAITSTGLIVVKGSNGQIGFVSPEEYKRNLKNYTLLTNGNLLAERMNNMPFEDSLLNIVLLGTSIKEISAIINDITSRIGSSTNELSGYTSVLLGQIQKGIALLQNVALKYGGELTEDMFSANGLYKVGVTDTNQQRLILLAVKSIYDTLNESQQALLKLRTDGTEAGVLKYIARIVGVGASDTFKYTLDIESGVDADGNKVGKSASQSSGDDKAQFNDAEILLFGMNEPQPLTLGYGNAVFTSMGRKSLISKYGGEAMGADFSYQQLYSALVAKILDLDQASFGDMPINKAFKDRIIVDNSDIYGVDLPYKTTEDGRIIPDFELLGKIRLADNTVLQLNLSPNNPADIAKINKIYSDVGLPVKYALDGSGNITLTGLYKRFAVILATADEKALLGTLSVSDNTFEVVDDDMEIDNFKEAMKKINNVKEYSLDKPGWFSFGDRHIVKGSIFIPITGSAVDARTASSSGKMTGGPTDYDTLRTISNAKKNYNNSAANINITQ